LPDLQPIASALGVLNADVDVKFIEIDKEPYIRVYVTLTTSIDENYYVNLLQNLESTLVCPNTFKPKKSNPFNRQQPHVTKSKPAERPYQTLQRFQPGSSSNVESVYDKLNRPPQRPLSILKPGLSSNYSDDANDEENYLDPQVFPGRLGTYAPNGDFYSEVRRR
jgi:hypothetical protein